MSLEQWEHFFKPEVRSSGRTLLLKDKVTQSRPSDREVQTYIRASGAVKVLFKCESVSDKTVLVSCTCPPFKKGQLCKHIWAALMACESKKLDFLEGKVDLQIDIQSNAQLRGQLEKKSLPYRKNEEFQATFKAKQVNYRKEQYQKQKQRLKDLKKIKKNTSDESNYPESVEKAFEYFAVNGFLLRENFTQEALMLAKKKLSRVFHPDRGGSHDEILELSANTEVLMKFAK